MKTQIRPLLWSLALLALFSTPRLASAYYDPGVQRWINRDPLADVSADSLPAMNQGVSVTLWEQEEGANLYAFVRNNPATNLDKEGRDPITPAEMISPPAAGGARCTRCTITGYTIYKSPYGTPIRRACHYECSGGDDSVTWTRSVTVDVGPKTPCPTGQDVAKTQGPIFEL